MPQPVESGSGGRAGAAGFVSCWPVSRAGMATSQQTATADHRATETRRLPQRSGVPPFHPQNKVVVVERAEIGSLNELSVPLCLCGAQLQLLLSLGRLQVMRQDTCGATRCAPGADGSR